MNRLLVIGAASDIAMSVSKIFGANNYDLTLALRNPIDLKDFADELREDFNINVRLVTLDIINFSSHAEIAEDLGNFDGIFCSIGYLGDQMKAEKDFQEVELIINSNFLGIVSMMNQLVNILEKKRKGFLIVISSVAGDRGRPSNYFYGSAKAALNAYLSGLRSRLYSKNIDVMIVKPGYVKTKMIAAIETPNFLTVSPDFAAKEIYKAHLTKKETIYIKSLWRLIMLIIRNIPSGIFKRLGI